MRAAFAPLIAIIFTTLGEAASAQSNPPATPPSGPTAPVIIISGWRLECSSATGDLTCQVFDRVSLRADNSVVGALSVRQSGPQKSPVVFVQVPLGIAIPNAVRVETGGGALQTIAILTCSREGCFGNAPLGEPLLNAMRAAKEPLHLAYDSLGAGSTPRTITVNLGLDGFAAAYDKLH